MDALDLLIADHNRVRGLFARFTAAKEGDDPAAMGELASVIDRQFEIHTTIEEEVFYPWARDLSDEIAEVVDEGVEEHHVVKVLLGEVRDNSHVVVDAGPQGLEFTSREVQSAAA